MKLIEMMIIIERSKKSATRVEKFLPETGESNFPSPERFQPLHRVEMCTIFKDLL